MLIDLHAHTSGISRCCRADAPTVLAAARDAGLDGIVLTNHYYKGYITDGDAAALARAYVDEFYYTEKVGKEMGMTVLFGIEVSMAKHGNVHMLVYGVSPEFLLERPEIHELTQEELYREVVAAGGVLVQAHPLRREVNRLLDVKYLHGVEVNSHPIYHHTHYKEMREVAEQFGLILTSGGDYHADTPYRPVCGSYIPDGTDTRGLATFLKTTSEIRLKIHEPSTGEVFEVDFTRTGGKAE